MKIEDMQNRLQKVLNSHRYNHSLGVMNEAVEMAELFGVDTKKARIAGLLHDCAKYLNASEAVAIAMAYGVELDIDTLNCPPVIHAPIGAIIANREYDVNDEEILQAIANHTVAGKNMTPLCKIIYVADMTEPNRDFEGVDKLRTLAKQNLDMAYKSAVKSSLMHTLKEGGYIHPMTIYAWNEINKGGEKNDRTGKITGSY